MALPSHLLELDGFSQALICYTAHFESGGLSIYLVGVEDLVINLDAENRVQDSWVKSEHAIHRCSPILCGVVKHMVELVPLEGVV